MPKILDKLEKNCLVRQVSATQGQVLVSRENKVRCQTFNGADILNPTTAILPF